MSSKRDDDKGAGRAAWVDEDDVNNGDGSSNRRTSSSSRLVSGTQRDSATSRALPAFLRQSHTTPAWAVTSAMTRRARDGDAVAATTSDTHARDEDDGDGGARHRGKRTRRAAHADVDDTATTRAAAAHEQALGHTRYRNDDVDALLSRTDALIATDADDDGAAGSAGARTPTVLSVLPLPRDAARTLHWLRNGQLAVVGGNRHVYLFHSAGRFVEQLCKVDVQQRLDTTALCAGEEHVVVAGHEAYVPQLLTLATEQRTPLSFLDTRSSAVYHGHGRADSRKAEAYLSHLATPQLCSSSSSGGGVLSSAVAVAHGRTVTLGSLTSGSVVTRIGVDDVVSDVHFTTPTQLLVASGNTLCVYDVRKPTAHLLRRVVDAAAVHISAVAVSPSTLAVGTSSGVVHVYAHGDYDKPTRVLKNLTTCIHHITLAPATTTTATATRSSSSSSSDVLAFASRSEKAAFRLVRLPEGGVVPSFPAVSMRHGFVQSLTLSRALPILSVGERQKVTNYAL